MWSKSLARKFPWIWIQRWENLERRHTTRRHKNLSRWTHLKSTPEGSMQKKCQRPWKVTISNSQLQMEQLKISGGDQRLRTWSLPPPQDSFPDAGEAINDFWSITGDFIYRHHVEPRVKLYSPREESFPFPLKYIDVTRTTHTPLDVMLEKNIDDCWNVDGGRELLDTWTGFTRFTTLKEKPPDGKMWSAKRLTRKQTTSRREKL